MFARIVAQSFARNPRRKALTALSLALGISVATATLSVALDVGDRLAREFRSLGANLIVTPAGDTLPLELGGVDLRPVDEGVYLREVELGKLRTIFWRLNITGFAPFLETDIEGQSNTGGRGAWRARLVGTWAAHDVPVPDGSAYKTGVATTHPWWRVEGRWFGDGARECVLGSGLARRAGVRAGDVLRIRRADDAQDAVLALEVVGIASTDGPEDEAVLAPLEVAQQVARRPGQFRRLLVSALTKPEDEFARRDPAKMTREEFDRWYCTPYISAIALQIREALPGSEVNVIRRVAEGEGRILTRVGALLWLVTAAALAGAALAVGAAAATTVLERREEVGLMKALGARNALVGAFFLAEQLLLALVGGAVGYVAGNLLASLVGKSVFGLEPEGRVILFPVALGAAALVAVCGSLLPFARAARFDPAPVLRGE